MRDPSKRSLLTDLILVILCVLLFGPAQAQYGTLSGDWPSYGGDTGSTKYSPLDQINAQNFQELEVAWTWTSIDGDLDLEAIQQINEAVRINNFQGTPLKVGDKLFIITALNQVAALDPINGETLWFFNPEVYLSGSPINYIGYHNRGLA